MLSVSIPHHCQINVKGGKNIENLLKFLLNVKQNNPRRELFVHCGMTIITNSAYDVSVGPLLKQLQLPSISDMIKQESASMVYKALNAEAPIYLAEQFTRVSDITSRTLRSSNLSLRPPRLKSRNGQNCFVYRGSYIWNSLSSEIKSSRTFGSFQAN